MFFDVFRRILVLLLNQPPSITSRSLFTCQGGPNLTFLPAIQTYPTHVNSRQNLGRPFLWLLHSGILGEEDTSRTSEIPAILLPITYQTHFPEGVYHCTMVDGTTIARGIEVTVDGSRQGSASSRNVKFTPADIFEGHTKSLSFLGCMDREKMQFL